MNLRRFTDTGLAAFRDYLRRLKDQDPTLDPPRDLLDDDASAQPLSPNIEATLRTFRNRGDFARWLHDAAAAADTAPPGNDPHFWAWLTLALFDQVCPARDGKRTPRETAWYIPAVRDPRRIYRHALYGSHTVYDASRKNGADAAIFLSNSLTRLGHFWYQIASRQDLITNPAVVSAATGLYFDPRAGRAKPGAATQKPGGVFRFVKLLNQLDRTWDLRLLSPNAVLDLLPAEFDPFKHTDRRGNATLPTRRTVA